MHFSSDSDDKFFFFGFEGYFAPLFIIMAFCIVFTASFFRASLSSIIFMRSVSGFGNSSRDSMAQRKFSKFGDKLYKSMIASRSGLIVTSISFNLSTASKNLLTCSRTSPPSSMRWRVSCFNVVAFLAGPFD